MAMEDRATTTIMAMETIMIMVVMEEDMETTTATMTIVAGTMAKVETTVELDMVRKMCTIIYISFLANILNFHVHTSLQYY